MQHTCPFPYFRLALKRLSLFWLGILDIGFKPSQDIGYWFSNASRIWILDIDSQPTNIRCCPARVSSLKSPKPLYLISRHLIVIGLFASAQGPLRLWYILSKYRAKSFWGFYADEQQIMRHSMAILRRVALAQWQRSISSMLRIVKSRVRFPDGFVLDF